MRPNLSFEHFAAVLGRRIIEYTVRLRTDSIRAKFDLSLAREMEDRFPRVLESIGPATRHAIRRVPPAQLVDEKPSPRALVREHAD